MDNIQQIIKDLVINYKQNGGKPLIFGRKSKPQGWFCTFLHGQYEETVNSQGQIYNNFVIYIYDDNANKVRSIALRPYHLKYTAGLLVPNAKLDIQFNGYKLSQTGKIYVDLKIKPIKI